MTIRDIVVAFGYEVDQKSVSAAEGTINSLKNTAEKLLGALGIGFSVFQMAKFAKECTDIASDVSEMQSKFEVVFGEMSEEVDEWADNYADSIGRSRSTIKTYLADQQNLLVGFTDGSEKARKDAAKLSEEMTSLALDIASFANTDEDIAVERMTKAVMGESEAAKGLGAVLNDVTRKEAMHRMSLDGTYDSLDQYTKMMVNLNAIQYQSKDAIGDCVNSMDRYESKTRQLAAKQKDLKEYIGTQLMPVMSVFVGAQTKLVEVATNAAKAILGESEEDNKLLKVMDGIQSLVKRLKPAFDRLSQTMSNGMSKARGFVQGLADKLGGMDNLLKILAIAATAFVAYMNWSKITKAAKGFFAVLSGIGKMFSIANMKILAVVAVIVALALIVEDFVSFLMGKDSVIGTIFDNAGIGADNAREAIMNAFGKVKDFIVNVYTSIKDFLASHSDQIRDMFDAVWNAIKTIFSAAFEVISALAVSVFGALQSFWENWGDEIMSVFQILGDYIGATFEFVIETITLFAQFLSAVFSGDIRGALEILKQIFNNILQQILNTVKTIFDSIWAVIGDKVTSIKDTIVKGFQSAIDWIKTLPGQAVQWGADFVNGLISGINSKIQGVINSVKGIADKIKSYLHFSVPDVGPLTDYESWMPDFMKGLGKGISDNESEVLDKVKRLAGGIKMLMSAATASAATARTGTVNNTTSSVTQNVNISNSYSGGSMETQRNVSKAMKKSAVDATTQMARSLAYARG